MGKKISHGNDNLLRTYRFNKNIEFCDIRQCARACIVRLCVGARSAISENTTRKRYVPRRYVHEGIARGGGGWKKEGPWLVFANQDSRFIMYNAQEREGEPYLFVSIGPAVAFLSPRAVSFRVSPLPASLFLPSISSRLFLSRSHARTHERTHVDALSAARAFFVRRRENVT